MIPGDLKGFHELQSAARRLPKEADGPTNNYETNPRPPAGSRNYETNPRPAVRDDLKSDLTSGPFSFGPGVAGGVGSSDVMGNVGEIPRQGT